MYCMSNTIQYLLFYMSLLITGINFFAIVFENNIILSMHISFIVERH